VTLHLRDLPGASANLVQERRGFSVRAADHPATGVLDYLARCERAASFRNHRDAVLHYQQCWRLVFDCAYGSIPLPFLRHDPAPYCPPIAAPTLKPWEIAKYSRPLRRVLRTFQQTCGGELEGGTYSATMLELECGHVLEDILFWDNDKPAKRRRCPQCASDMHAAAVIAARRQSALGGA
jgi:hypothetical protein